MSQRTKAHIGLLLTNLFFAVNLSALKHLTGNNFIEPFGINLFRVGVTVILLWISYSLRPSDWRISRKDLPRFLVCALTGIAINQMLFVKGVSLTYSIHASLLMLITPILITLFASWLLKEKFTFTKGIGLALGVAGAVILISGKENTGTGENVLLGDILVLLNAVSYTFYMVLVKPLMKKYPPVHVIRWVFSLALLIITPFCWVDFMEVDWNTWGAFEIGCLVVIVIAGTFLAYLFNIYGIKVLGSSVAGSYIYLQPAFATTIAILFLDEPFTWTHIISAVLIFAGVYLANKTPADD
jgi:drug/metabolite transporter (DMT)-like permease